MIKQFIGIAFFLAILYDIHMKTIEDMYITSKQDMIEAVQALGILPFFKNSIRGFSIEERCSPKVYFSSSEGVWEWKGPVIVHTGCAYGKFFEGKAAFVSSRWINDFANYKRDGYDFDARVDDEDLLHLGELEFKVIHTPGHTSGGSCLYCEQEKLLFSGDTLFRGTWGRTDVPTGDFESVIKSITKKLMILPDETIVYPGHGKSTMIREEKPIYLELKPRLL